MKVSVVTPNYNGEKFLKTFFESLNNDSDLIGEVIIVDNGSTDKSKEYIKNNTFNFPVILIENTDNLGFSPAVNQGILKARYEYIFSLNNDTEIKPGSIKALTDLISSDENIFSVQAKMLQYNNKQLI
ncbi:MAG: glycosyltransferase, partial [Methanobrevibacter sp.]|nr:glycosyltransferase [Methanobrevibacter sp.]